MLLLVGLKLVDLADRQVSDLPLELNYGRLVLQSRAQKKVLLNLHLGLENLSQVALLSLIDSVQASRNHLHRLSTGSSCSLCLLPEQISLDVPLLWPLSVLIWLPFHAAFIRHV